MKTLTTAFALSVSATTLMAQETREMDAHVHGVSTFEMAVESGMVEMNLTSPGMDIVGFEYEASTDADKDAVEAAIRQMLTPEAIVTLPEAAECRLTEVLAHLHAGDHDHDEEHAEGGRDHDADHAEGEAHGHEEAHAEGEDHDHEEGAVHSEFHARYKFACEHPEDLTTVGFPFFALFANAEEIEAQYVTDAGAGAAEVTADAPQLVLN